MSAVLHSLGGNCWRVTLRCGTLSLQVDESAWPLSELCAFGSRRNRKRGFLFISKVLGKHYPVRPAQMHAIHDYLAARLGDCPGPVLTIALAETATALGQGVYECLCRQTGRADLLFLHTTRYRLEQPLALCFEESHSHATEHLVYQPCAPEHQRLFGAAQTLLLIDDEISTGRTLGQLAQAYRRINPGLRQVGIVSITDWLEPERRLALAAEIGVPTRFTSVLRGRFHFDPNPAFDPGPLPDVVGRGEKKDRYLARNHGRLGTVGVLPLETTTLVRKERLPRGGRVLVLGSGEFAYPPYRLARALEADGHEVYFQSTTRSPILPGEDIASVLEFEDNYHDGIPNYLYNGDLHSYDRVLIGYETTPLPSGHCLPERLGAETFFF